MTAPRLSLRRRIANQSVLLVGGTCLAQLLAFARNALLAYGLSKGDFGVAAALLLVLQLIEAITEFGPERLIVQAPDGDTPHMMAAGHAAMVLRGLFAALLVFLTAPLAARLFGIPDAAGDFAWLALAPLIKGFQHLDSRRRQRLYDGGPAMLVELIPQAIVLVLTLPLVKLMADPSIVVGLVTAQAVLAVAVSHVIATTPYRLAMDRIVLARIVAFGWPLLASALPHAVVVQGERALVGGIFGVEALAGYTAAFMVAMVPGLIASRAGQSLILPLLASSADNEKRFTSRFTITTEIVVISAAGFLAMFVAAGGAIVATAFGKPYADMGTVVAWLACMWALRSIAAVPAYALIARGHTQPLLPSALIRALALLPAAWAALTGYGLATIAAIGVAGECASLLYICSRLGSAEHARILLSRLVYLIPAAAIASLTIHTSSRSTGVILGAFAAGAIVLVGFLIMPHARTMVVAWFARLRNSSVQAV